jgi:hypothetical protein
MSRLDSFIRRMNAQRDCLNAAAEAVRNLPGAAFELGLGNGRTYDHMCEIMPDRDIYVFERHIAAHPMNIPDDDHLFMGDIMDTLPAAAARFEGAVALAHTDLGTGVKEENEKLAAKVAPLLWQAMAPGGVVISGDALPGSEWAPGPHPESVAPERYFVYRKP